MEALNTIKQGIVYGFAGYGAGTIYEVNPILAAKIGVVYAIGYNVLSFAARQYYYTYDQRVISENNLILSCDALAIAAARSFNLIGNRGMALLGTFALLRYTFVHYRL